MIDGTYEIMIDTLFGSKSGTVELHTDGDRAIGEIDAPVIGKQHVEGQLEGENAFIAKGTHKLKLVGEVEFTLRGKVDGDTLHVSLQTNKGDFNFAGHRMR